MTHIKCKASDVLSTSCTNRMFLYFCSYRMQSHRHKEKVQLHSPFPLNYWLSYSRLIFLVTKEVSHLQRECRLGKGELLVAGR